MSFYGGHWHDPRQRKYVVGMARADHLSDPWERCYDLSPSGLTDRFSENPVVTRLKDGRYSAVFDCIIEEGDAGDGISNANAIGYSVSRDGKHWPYRKVVNLLPDQDWTLQMRTPLGLIPEEDNVFRVYYSCKHREKKGDGLFFPIGMTRVKLVD